jgi:hypothetical protein
MIRRSSILRQAARLNSKGDDLFEGDRVIAGECSNFVP